MKNFILLVTLVFLPVLSCANVWNNNSTRSSAIALKGIWIDSQNIALNDQGGGIYDYFLSREDGTQYPLVYIGFVQNQNDENWKKQFSYLVSDRYQQFKISLPQGTLKDLIKGPVLISKIEKSSRKLIEVFSVSLSGLLDREFSYTGPDLGLTFKEGVPSFKIWAPTAKRVVLKVFKTPSETDQLFPPLEMKEGGDHVWFLKGASSWKNFYYKFEIESFKRRKNQYTTESITDLYSVNLSMNGLFSQIVDVENDVFPEGWKNQNFKFRHAVNDFSDVALYELHVRDFSMFDFTQPQEDRGKFLAFTNQDTNGVRHLAELAAAGITHIHFLPINDISSVEEDAGKRIDFKEEDFRYFSSLFGSSQEQQNLATRIRERDGYNWGYDPAHYMALEGSYSSDPNSTARILEFRKLVMSLHSLGLGVVQDVVYNHYSGVEDLDSFVPDYYYSLNGCGEITMDSCCDDLATENKMVQRLIVDSAVNMVRWYRLDGIRFDLMGFLTKSIISEIRSKLNGLTLEKEGINGSKVLMYGEGWSFGPLFKKLPNEAVTQTGAADLNIGVGTFNDRIRDALKGKGQNAIDLFNDDAFITDKVQNRDSVLSGLFGSLKGFKEGYVNQPYESINYVAAHDKNTLWDTLMAKIGPYATADQVVRIEQLAFSFLTFAQGIPFYHAGEEILRSKSGDENSYNSGDWFNRIDFTYKNNGWNSGLPPQFVSENNNAWPNWKLRLDYVSAPQSAHIRDTFSHFKDVLNIRFSSKLFHLSSREQIFSKVTFPVSLYDSDGYYNPKVVAVKIDDNQGIAVDSQWEKAWALFNTSWDRCGYYVDSEFENVKVQIHPILKNSSNRFTRDNLNYKCPLFKGQGGNDVVSIPPQSTLVFVKQR